MIACIAPSDRFYEENLSTLNYATRASNIANAPTKNIDPKIREIQELKKKNKALQLELHNANKHIEFLTSLTSEQLQTFGSSLISDKIRNKDDKTELLEMPSPLKSNAKSLSSNGPTVPKVATKTQSIGGTSTGYFQSNSGMSTQTENRMFPIQQQKKKSARSKSKQPNLLVEKRESIEDIAKRKKFEEKMHLITNEINSMNKNREDTSNRFTDAMTRVTDLLKVNQMLREDCNVKEDTIRKKNIEIFGMRDENEELRDKIELLETIVQSDRDAFDKYVSSHLINEAQRTQMGEYIGIDEGSVQIDSVYVELLELRRIVRKLEKRNKNLERQNMENQYQMHFIGNNEPSRPIMKDGSKSNLFNSIDSPKKQANLPPPIKTLSKHNSVPSMIEPKTTVGSKGVRKMKGGNKNKVANYKTPSDDDFFSSNTLMRNGDYAMAKDSWQKIELNYKKNKSPSPMIAISSSSVSSEKDLNNGEEEKFINSGSNWGKDDTGFVNRLLSKK